MAASKLLCSNASIEFIRSPHESFGRGAVPRSSQSRQSSIVPARAGSGLTFLSRPTVAELIAGSGVPSRMQPVSYYLTQAEKAERLADLITDQQAQSDLLKMAQDYRDIAEDLENGAIEIRHPERMPQLRHSH
jgi:hypothetical protein